MVNTRAAAGTPTWTRRALRLVIATTLFVAAGYLGRATIIDGEALSLIWPAAGVAALWIGSGHRSTIALDLAALATATFIVNNATGAAPDVALVFVVSNLAQVCLFVLLVRTTIPGLFAFGGRRPLERLLDLGQLCLSAVTACLVGASVGTLGLDLVHGSTPMSSFLVWWGRNSVALIVITTLGVLVGHPIAAAGRGRRWAVVRAALTARSPGRLGEVFGLIAGSVGLYLALFLGPSGQPLAFLVLVMSVWAGLRFAPLAVTVHGLAMGMAGIAFTLAGNGPFAGITSPHYQALVAQIFVAMTVLTGLALAFSRAERDRANVDLAAARRAADERARLLDAVLESLNEGVVVVEEGGRILVRNTAGRHLLGFEGTHRDEIQPASAYGLHRTNGVPVEDHELPGRRALAGEVVGPEDFHVRAPSVPHGRVVEISAIPLEGGEAGAPKRAMVNIRDVTLDRQHRDTLASFAGVVAHDLLNPLAVVDGWTEALEDEFGTGPVLPTTGLPIVARIHDAAVVMRDFIGDLMSYTVARDQSLRTGSVDLTRLVRTLAELHAETASAPVIAVADDLRAWADEGLMRQLFDNLIGNAVKYVGTGTRPAVSVAGSYDEDWLTLTVTDNGIGIPEEERDEIFESFHRVHTGYSGTGLGLAICRRIVDRHGGTIHAEPGPNSLGTRFVIRLPVAPAALQADVDQSRSWNRLSA